MLELKNVSFRYAKNLPLVLDGVSLSFDKGEFVAITGRNGSGKTTITRLLTGLEKPASGDIVYNGTSVTKEDASKRSRFIGYVFQQPDRQMFMPTVREEIAFGPFHQGKRGQELEDAIDRAMADTDTESLSAEYPRTLSRTSFPAGSSSGWPLPPPWPWIRNTWCSMNLPADRTAEKRKDSWPSWKDCSRKALPLSWLPTTWTL